jgi:hypothetical protein
MSVVGLRKLCTPAMVYLIISLSSLLILVIQNYFFNGNINVFCLGTYSCTVSSIFLIFIIKILYILFWTWILNLICNAGASGVAWFLVLLPFILMFILMAMLMVW